MGSERQLVGYQPTPFCGNQRGNSFEKYAKINMSMFGYTMERIPFFSSVCPLACLLICLPVCLFVRCCGKSNKTRHHLQPRTHESKVNTILQTILWLNKKTHTNTKHILARRQLPMLYSLLPRNACVLCANKGWHSRKTIASGNNFWKFSDRKQANC